MHNHIIKNTIGHQYFKKFFGGSKIQLRATRHFSKLVIKKVKYQQTANLFTQSVEQFILQLVIHLAWEHLNLHLMVVIG